MPDFDYGAYVHKPDDLARMHIDYAEYIQNHPGIKFGLSTVDKRVIPLRPGNLAAICGRPGHGKSSLMARQANFTASDIIKRKAQKQEAVFYVTFEQTAEELEMFFEINQSYNLSDYAWGNVSLDAIKRNAIRRVDLPVWIIGHSLKYANQKLPPMTPELVFEILENVKEDYGVEPVLMCLDYVQLIPVYGRFSNRVERINDAVIGAKHLAMRIGCPIVLGVQAGRNVDEQKKKIPQMSDSQWCSAIEQTVDKFFGIWRPWQTEDHNKKIQLNDKDYDITPELFVLQMSKQRMEDGRHTWVLHFSPQELKLAELEIQAPPPF